MVNEFISILEIIDNFSAVVHQKPLLIHEELTAEAIKNFSEEAAINYFNNIHDNDISGGIVNALHSNHCTFNPLDKLVEAYQEKEKLYERLLQAEKDKVQYLEELLKSK